MTNVGLWVSPGSSSILHLPSSCSITSRGLRRPLHQPSCRSLPLSLAVRANAFLYKFHWVLLPSSFFPLPSSFRSVYPGACVAPSTSQAVGASPSRSRTGWFADIGITGAYAPAVGDFRSLWAGFSQVVFWSLVGGLWILTITPYCFFFLGFELSFAEASEERSSPPFSQ